MSTTDLTVSGEGPSPALANAIQSWAVARTDPTSSRRDDLVKDKRRAVGDFFSFMGKHPAEVQPGDVQAWQAALEARGLAHSTIYGMISRVSSFYRWAMKDPELAEHIQRNPVILARPKAPKAYQNESCKSLDDDEAAALLSVVKGKASFDVVGKRDYALLLLFMTTGMRRREILNLRWKHIRLNGHLTFTAKLKGGDKVNQDVDNPAVVDALTDYLKASGRWGHLQPDDPLWTRHDRAGEPGAPMAANSFARNLKRYARKVGIDHIHVHQLRHTGARLVEEATGSVGAVQDFLNHKNRATTRAYLGAVRVKKDRHSGAILDRLGV